ncbi:bifunctional diaminohydroxyphosphoribosylaminopyrimidine deaminase/5-amino-6-(5-phosphoribosylamino)uracil reductase RibD [Rivibacter subsaxonicus]|uniref:Riboflavin biosynthesis protein RibD n=1 Tax=Rivibacter subsaxonicus TaxID=457575 RepID=A0A4Q7VNJ6_9BURK|nr:bifunctional diaminohydroxyphosphoribosylaminopyrimidine deaminase/5-amino-6-(5-phosphoribosylamino)uracil reductase RibD [Rivibacter subsaxonicus]RZT97950.1 diaminohydroxyphosphoribosylaminopyrimidine deaminase/5-amino-6-(5-phosphoribosylamino)uracil reductase [Rivibacter subsaxonicus]
MLNDRDAVFTRTLALAEQAIGLSDPNPRVGCVLLAADGAVIGEGHTQRAGEAHAEIMALRAARAAGLDPRGATAVVSLEPCSHHGRTPPCCDALVEAGVARVLVASTDPNPQVAGRGIERLRAAGIEVELVGGAWGMAARELNIGFFSRMERGLPWVRLKIAASLDGRTALENGASQWITGPEARADGHAWRRRAGAVLTGIGTVRDDDPRLDVRLVPSALQPLRVVVDSRLELAPAARLLAPPGLVLVACALDPDGAEQASRAAALRDGGAELVCLPGAGNKVDLGRLLQHLAEREQVNELHIEAGHKLNGSLLRASLVDELLVYLAPTLLGLGREMAAFGPLSSLTEALAFGFTGVERVGADLRLLARRRE